METPRLLICTSLILFSFSVYGQNTVGIGTEEPNPNAVLQLVSPDKNQGLLITRLSTEERNNTSFIANLGDEDNGLLVYDSTENQFYYWHSGNWNPISTSTAGTASLDDDPSNELQSLSLSGQDLTISDGNTVSLTPLVGSLDQSSSNEIQDLELTGNTLLITNNSSATPIDLSPFQGTNTDNQTLSISGSDLSITGGNTVDLATIPPSGAAGGDLTGTYPNPTIVNNAITTAKINNNAVNSAKISNGTIVNADVNNSANIAASKLQSTVLVEGENVSLLNNNAGYITSASIPTALPPSGAAGGDLTGTYPNPTINNNAVTTAKINNNAVTTAKIGNGQVNSNKIANGTIQNVDVNNAAAIAGTKISPNFGGQTVQTTGQGIFNQLRVTNGPQSGFVLTSDASGNGTWQAAPSPFSTTNIIPKGNGSTLVSSGLFDNGSYIGYGRTAPIFGSSFFEFASTATTGFVGLNIFSNGAQPYYGYVVSGTLQAYTYVDTSDRWIINNNGSRMVVANNGDVTINGPIVTPGNNVTAATTLPRPVRRVMRVSGSATILNITAGADGQEVIILNRGTATFLVRASTSTSGNIILNNFTDYAMARQNTLHLIYDSGLGAWVEIGRSFSRNYTIIN